MRQGWLIQYGVLVLVAVLLGAILGSFPLFTDTALFGTRLRASHIVQFLGFGAGLAFLVMMAHRASLEFQDDTVAWFKHAESFIESTSLKRRTT